METVQPIELIWLVLNCVGLFFSIYNIIDSQKDMRAADDLTNGNKPAAKEMVKLSIQQDVVRTVPLFLFVIVGVVAVTLPADPQPQSRPIAGGIIALCFVLVSVGLVLNSLFQFIGRRRILRLLRVRDG
jgi:hypothetical protein